MSQTATMPFAAPAGEPAPDAPAIAQGASGRAGDRILRWATLLSALLVLALLVGLVGVLTVSAIPSVRTFGWRFLVARDWRPNPLEVPKRDAAGNVVMEDGEVAVETIPPTFGALPVIYGTAVSSLLALLF